MKYIYIALLVIIIVIALCCYCRKEKFTAAFIKSDSSLQFLEYYDMGDHRTMVQLQRGNSGETVLLLHNTPMNLDIWMPLFQTMQRINMTGVVTPNLVAYDIRGNGTAWLPVDDKYNDLNIKNYAWKLEQFVEDCKQIYDKVIGNGKIKICGIGFGGIIAQKYALTYPETIEKLILLQTSIRPTPGLYPEINYLAGPQGWIAKNPHVTYLTSEEKFVQQNLCNWFYLPEKNNCPKDPLVDQYDDNNDQTSPQYNLVAKMWRQGSSTTLLQIDKLRVSTDLVPDWEKAKVSFGIHILSATDDPYSPPDVMTATYTTIYNNNRHLVVALDIVNGRHAFYIMRPDYIAGIICGDCEHVPQHEVASAKNTIRAPDHGF
uniref:Alpha/beta hydrolase fold protein n=1 Tax=Marseillevirus LCMAC201 TaxID=2506605 RepID=A0A481YX32_9VIRU|nr:MAG: alpha/beta hydrolase fold protein [Marseillevirus LCMAC201]